MKELTRKVLVFIHLLVAVLIIIGPFLPGRYLIYYLLLWPMLHIHWHLNNGMCMLTELEYNTDTNFFSNINEYIFFSRDNIFSFLRKINIFVSDEQSYHNLLEKIRGALWIVAFIRALIYYRKDIVKWSSKIRKHFIFRFLCDSYKT